MRKFTATALAHTSLAGLLLTALLLGCCSRCKPPSAKPPATLLAVRIPGTMGAPKTLRLGLRASYAQRTAPIGRLSSRGRGQGQGQGHGHGLLYVYPRDRALGVNLASSAGPVDVVLLDAQRRVLRVAEAVAPAKPKRVTVIPRLYRYAILLPAKGARKAGLAVGVQVTFTLPDRAQPQRVLTAVSLYPKRRPTVRVLAEVALTEPERTMGLMWRTRLPANGGMLFRFEKSYFISFWMKNTLISLDMIFLDDNHMVTGVVHRAKPKSESSSDVGRVNSRYVLEVPAGFARRNGITRGTTASFSLP